jgi:hypothetical protein
VICCSRPSRSLAASAAALARRSAAYAASSRRRASARSVMSTNVQTGGGDRAVGVVDRGRVDHHRAAGAVAALEVDLLAGDHLARAQGAGQRPLLGLVRPAVRVEAPVRPVLVEADRRLERLPPDPLDLGVAEHQPAARRLADDHPAGSRDSTAASRSRSVAAVP